MEPQPGSPPPPPPPPSPSPEISEVPAPLVVVVPPSDEPEEEAGVKPDRQSSSSSSSSSSSEEEEEDENLFHPDVAVQTSVPLVVAASPDDEAVASGDGGEVKPDDEAVSSGDAAVVRPDDWASWPQQPAQSADVGTDGGGALPGPTTTQAAPEVQTMSQQPVAEAAAVAGFDPERIPKSIFQAKPLASSSQAEWSVASNESLFSIHHGARPSADLCGFYAGESRSHFDYFYDEAMAAAGGADQPSDWKLATVAEGSPAGSARSDASGGGGSADRAKHNAAIEFRRHESGSAGSSSNFSFAFPILAETTTSPRKRDYGGGGGMYQPLQKEVEQPPPVPSPASAFEEMTTEEERRRRRTSWWCCCGECCGCCWFACSWSSCCCCCQWRWWWCSRCNCDCRCRCPCPCPCPTLCRCNWCLCF